MPPLTEKMNLHPAELPCNTRQHFTVHVHAVSLHVKCRMDIHTTQLGVARSASGFSRRNSGGEPAPSGDAQVSGYGGDLPPVGIRHRDAPLDCRSRRRRQGGCPCFGGVVGLGFGPGFGVGGVEQSSNGCKGRVH